MYLLLRITQDWLDSLRRNAITHRVNYWLPAMQNVHSLQKGDPVVLLAADKALQVVGIGSFVEQREMAVDDAWREFGTSIGYATENLFRDSLKSYPRAEARGSVFCIILDDIRCFDEPVDAACCGVDAASSAYVFPRFTELPAVLQPAVAVPEPFVPLADDVLREYTRRELTDSQRVGQDLFRDELVEAYGGRCCICGEAVPQILQAAHIQEYINEKSQHVQNGLLLRSDFHLMYDSGLLTVDTDYVVHIAKQVTCASDYYLAFDGQQIFLPADVHKWPSVEALREKIKEYKG